MKKEETKEGKKEEKETQEEMRALFVSYLELNTYVKNKTEEESKENIKKIIRNTKENQFNTILFQVRSFDDAIYPTEKFPKSTSILLKDGSSYDVLSYFLEEAKKEQIEVYLWINPFRITRENEELKEESMAYQYKDTRVVQKVGNSYYYNPAREETTSHIVEGIIELIENYSVKGILFDDYFYPNDEIDSIEYEEYQKNNPIDKETYHLKVINEFIKQVYQNIKKIDQNVKFGISPDGNIENNYHKNYADVKTWCKEEGYIDFIMPQLYYGFTNSTKPFIETMNTWNQLVENKKEKIYYALAFYKVGKEDQYAKEGKNEWLENSDMIKKQIIMIRNTENYGGFALFRYDYLFNEENYQETTLKELEHLREVIVK